MASSKNRSTSTGRSAETPPSARSERRERQDCLLESFVVIDDLHCPAPEHIARTDQHRIADPGGDDQRLGDRGRCAARWLGDPELFAKAVPPLAVFGEVDRGGRSPENKTRLDRVRQLEWGLAAERDDDTGERRGVFARGRDTGGELRVYDVAHVFGRERLEIEPVGGVVVGGDGLRVAVDHDSFVARLTKAIEACTQQ